MEQNDTVETTDTIVGLKISAVRWMTDEEKDDECWSYDQNCLVIELEDGSKLYAMRDEEGNGPGCMVVVDADGESYFMLPKE